ncbi:MAG: TraM recognition domain-containing protein [Eggerthellaceae bacterium]
MRGRGVSASIIIQNMAQLRALFDKQWESIVGNCDEFLYLGGNEQSTHKYVSELLGKETIDLDTHGRTTGRAAAGPQPADLGRELMARRGAHARQLPRAALRAAAPHHRLKLDIARHPPRGSPRAARRPTARRLPAGKRRRGALRRRCPRERAGRACAASCSTGGGRGSARGRRRAGRGTNA